MIYPFISVRSQKDIEDEDTSFGPEMCHQVFGENENIFGYQDLQIHLYYSAGSLLTYLGIEYTDKVGTKLKNINLPTFCYCDGFIRNFML